MSVEQYQRTVNSLDDEIAKLEKRKGELDKKAADARKKASRVKINKNASASTIKMKMSQIERYNNNAIKAEKESANLQKKISDKQKKRNASYLKLQKAQSDEQKKQTKEINKIKSMYENRIVELSNVFVPQNVQLVKNIESESQEKYDVFISHAWEDKETFVDEFVKELECKGANVWYDKTQMKWGDTMREKIDEGLKKSKFGIIVLSPNYIAEEKYWTKTELDGLFQLESINGKNLLPIWHNLTKKQVIDYSPIIASKLAMNTASMTPSEIADELIKILHENEMEVETSK